MAGRSGAAARLAEIANIQGTELLLVSRNRKLAKVANQIRMAEFTVPLGMDNDVVRVPLRQDSRALKTAGPWLPDGTGEPRTGRCDPAPARIEPMLDRRGLLGGAVDGHAAVRTARRS